MEMSREKYKEIRSAVERKYGQIFPAVIDTVLEEAGHTIPPPPILPGVTKGKWMPCCGHNAEAGEYYIIANGVKIATAYVPANRLIMARSRDMAIYVMKFLSWLAPHGPDRTGISAIDLEKEGKAILEQAGIDTGASAL